jgi:quercetin dioxygenase-like cupin family protein
MVRILLALAVGAGVGGVALAHDRENAEAVKVLSARNVKEKLDGKDAKATTVELALEPGQAGTPHRHAGPVFGYVLEGEYEHAIDKDPVKTYKAGDTFYEPSGCVHRVTRNPSKTAKTRLLAVILHPRDTKETTVPEKGKE